MKLLLLLLLLCSQLLDTDASDWSGVPRNPGRWGQNSMAPCPLASTLNARLLQVRALESHVG
jgi:hypothetical protein